jgi:hypothetical protein
VVAVCAITLGAPVAAPAAITQTFTTSQSEFTPGVRNQGWWSATFANGDDNDNYFAGVVTLPGPTPVVLRNFFSFDLSSACRAATVTLQLTRFTQTGPLPYLLFDVSTPAPVLNANDVVNPAIFADLGTGAYIYGNSERAGTQQLTVTCLPENNEECKNGGWRDFGDTFKNQGSAWPSCNAGPSPRTSPDSTPTVRRATGAGRRDGVQVGEPLANDK